MIWRFSSSSSPVLSVSTVLLAGHLSLFSMFSDFYIDLCLVCTSGNEYHSQASSWPFWDSLIFRNLPIIINVHCHHLSDHIPINRWVAGNRPLSLWLAAFIPRLLLCLVLVSFFYFDEDEGVAVMIAAFIPCLLPCLVLMSIWSFGC